jgi:deoxycytidylate deaminase
MRNISMTGSNFSWSELAFGSKKPLNLLKATFIAAPRQLSQARLKQLIQEYLPKGNVILGIAREPYVLGFEDQPQFRTLQLADVEAMIAKINASKTPHKIYTLEYFQRELPYILEKLELSRVVLISGSWKHTFHTGPAYYALANRRIEYHLVSPFVDEAEAGAFEAQVGPQIERHYPVAAGAYDEADMMALAGVAAKHSYDYSFQTGVTLGKRSGSNYKLLAWSFNKVVPFQTYAMHYGASRETNFSPPHDLNHYDTVHAEVELLIKAQRNKLDLADTTLFINLLPCSSCARMLADTDIAEFVYVADHSNGYAVGMLERAGKKVRRLASAEA